MMDECAGCWFDGGMCGIFVCWIDSRVIRFLDRYAGDWFVGWMCGPFVCWMDVRVVGLLEGCTA